MGNSFCVRQRAMLVWLGVVAASLMANATATVVRAGDDQFAITASYGMGVHAYYSGHYQRSHEDFSGAIEAGSIDPRVFYFRGLAAIKLGRFDEAQADFAEGASKEAAGWGGRSVSRSLERVQGPDRLRLEQYRVRARVVAIKTDREASKRRYVEQTTAEPNVLRQRRPAGIPAGEDTPTPATTPPDDTNVFAEESEGPQPGKPTTPAGETEDPFGEPPAAEEMDEPPVGKKPAEAESDTDDPFGGPPDGEKPAAEEPAAEEMDEPPVDEKPAEAKSETDDPFGDEKPPSDAQADQKDAQMEAEASESNDTADQKDAQMEAEASESNDTADQKDAQMEAEASESNDTADQKDAQMEAEASESNDTADQKDAQMEAEAAAGEGGTMVEEIKGDTTSLQPRSTPVAMA